MASLRVVRPGMLTTVQDLGRFGHAAIGVSPAGACDTLSLRVGNRLVGNADGAAALEMTLVGGELEFDDERSVVLAGATSAAVLRTGSGATPLQAWTPAHVRAGDRLVAGPLARGARAYVCISGGIATAPVLGSRSLHVSSGLGGAPVRGGDVLPLGPRRAQARFLPRAAQTLVVDSIFRGILRFRLGPHWPVLRKRDMDRLFEASFTVAERSDRMGLRLSGLLSEARIPRRLEADGRMITEGVPPGAVQLPPGGEPIILLADRPTTGGYPVIGCIAAVDLPACGQLRPRDAVRFEHVDLNRSRELLRDLHGALDAMLPPVEG
jgi:biotin-dependent carboxylase-like uncharacterized protein